MPTTLKTRLIDELSEKLVLLEKQKRMSENEANTLAEKRDRLNEKVKNLRSEIHRLRSERDEINKKVKQLKLQRNDTKARIQKRIGEIRKLSEENRIVARKKPTRSHPALQEEVESIDWQIQTASPTLQEDKELMERVRQLENQLNIHRKIEHLNERIQNLRDEVSDLKGESKCCHETLLGNATKSQELHEKMLAKMEESKKMKIEADEIHRQFVAAKEGEKPLQQEVASVWSKIAELRGETRMEEEKEKRRSEDVLRQTLEQKAKEKLKRRERLSWEEFQLLAQKGDVTAQD